jgi:hypothetical protein
MRFLTPFPSPASAIEQERKAFMAGEGSEEERRLRPLSKTHTPFQTIE